MLENSQGSDDERLRAAEAALGEVRDGMKLGLGTGRTANHFVRFLAVRVRAGLKIAGVPTSEKTAKLARAEGIPLTSLDDEPVLDLTVDGADEIDPSLRLIKGGGGALLREKIVAAASRRMIVVGDAGKLVATLGAVPLPIEVVPFGLIATRLAIEKAAGSIGVAGEVVLRQNLAGKPFVTDGGHHIFDAHFGRIPDPESLAGALGSIPGVVEHGLFIGLTSTAIIARGDCIEWLSP